jgi:phosphoadenosine phosphosulfate reductase
MDLDLQSLNRELEHLPARDRVGHVYEVFGEGLILSTSFGPTAGVMLRLATDVYPEIRVITVRHGHETARTLQVADHYARALNLNLRVYEAPWMEVPDEDDAAAFEDFKRAVKMEPFQRALDAERPAAWLSGVMRGETEQRKTFDFAMDRNGLPAVYPILDWEETYAEEFCLAHGLPLNRDYHDPAKGRTQKRECGLHLGGIGASWTSSGL